MKNKVKVAVVFCILRPAWLLAEFEISVDNSLTIGPQKINETGTEAGFIYLLGVK